MALTLVAIGGMTSITIIAAPPSTPASARKLPLKTKCRPARYYVQQKNPKEESLFSCSLSLYSLSMKGMELGAP